MMNKVNSIIINKNSFMFFFININVSCKFLFTFYFLFSSSYQYDYILEQRARSTRRDFMQSIQHKNYLIFENKKKKIILIINISLPKENPFSCCQYYRVLLFLLGIKKKKSSSRKIEISVF